MMPSGLSAKISSALVNAGYTVTSQPRLVKDLAIFSFAPRSSSATFFPSPEPLCTYFCPHVAFSTTLPVVYAFNRGSIFSREYASSVVIMPFIVPFSRSIFVNALVSIPAIPGTSNSSRNRPRSTSLRKLLPLRANSLMINPSTHGLDDSISSLHTP